MKTILLYCETIEQELRSAMVHTGVTYPCVQLESGLHNVPARLTKRLQEELDHLPEDTERVLMGFGFCGNAVAGLRTGGYELIIPRVDDCITLLLGSCRERSRIMEEEGTYFLTEGWLKGERNLWVEFQHAQARYGERTARRMLHSMLAHYSRLAVIDTGAYDLERTLPATKEIAGNLGLRHQVLPGTLQLLCTLLTGPWDSRQFLIVPPHAEIGIESLRLSRD